MRCFLLFRKKQSFVDLAFFLASLSVIFLVPQDVGAFGISPPEIIFEEAIASDSSIAQGVIRIQRGQGEVGLLSFSVGFHGDCDTCVQGDLSFVVPDSQDAVEYAFTLSPDNLSTGTYKEYIAFILVQEEEAVGGTGVTISRGATATLSFSVVRDSSVAPSNELSGGSGGGSGGGRGAAADSSTTEAVESEEEVGVAPEEAVPEETIGEEVIPEEAKEEVRIADVVLEETPLAVSVVPTPVQPVISAPAPIPRFSGEETFVEGEGSLEGGIFSCECAIKEKKLLCIFLVLLAGGATILLIIFTFYIRRTRNALV